MASQNVLAFLRVIREGETNQTDDAYRLINGGAYFDAPPWVHPFDGIPTTQGGKAAGAYQFLGTTWYRLGLPDFSPPNQDAGAIKLIEGRHALAEVEAGDLETAIDKLKEEWVSLPIILANGRAARVFAQYGGSAREATQTAPAVPPSQPIPTGAATPQGSPMPLLLALLPAVLNLFAPRAQAALQKVTGAPPDVVGQFAQSVIGKVQELTGKPDPVQAVAAITADPKPEVVQAVQESALDHLDKLMPVLDKLAEYDKAMRDSEIAGRDAAAKRAQGEKWDMTPWLIAFAGTTATLVVVAFTAAIVYQALGKDEISTALVGLAGPLLAIAMGVWREVFAYRFDSTPNSTAKDAIIAELAKK